MPSRDRLAEQALVSDRDKLRRSEQLFAAEMDAERARIEAEAPIRRLRIQDEHEVLAEQLEMQELKNRLRALTVEHDLEQARAEQELRRAILPLEQAPEIVDAASGVLRGANLSLYGDDNQLIRHVAPVLDAVSHAVERTLAASARGADGSHAAD